MVRRTKRGAVASELPPGVMAAHRYCWLMERGPIAVWLDIFGQQNAHIKAIVQRAAGRIGRRTLDGEMRSRRDDSDETIRKIPVGFAGQPR